MSVIEKRLYCPDCDKSVLAHRPNVNHILHLLMTCCTLSVWLWCVWIPCIFFNMFKHYKCNVCGCNCTKIKY